MTIKLLPASRAIAGSLILSASLLLTGTPASAQTTGSILIVSKPAEGTPKDSFLDLAPHVEPALRETAKLDALAFKADLPAVRSLIQAGTLTESDVKPPISRAAAHKIAQALGAHYILTVSAASTRDGVVANAETEANLTLDQWTTLANDRMVTGKMKGRQLSLLESVHVLVSGLVEKVQGAISRGPSPSGGAARQGVPQVSETTTLKQRANAKPPAAAPPPTGSGKEPTPAAGNGQPLRGAPNPAAANNPPARPANAPSTYELLIDKARRNGDTANLLVALRRAVTEKPRDVRLRLDLIKAYKDRGWQDMAREEASRAASIAPTDPSIHRLLGESLIETGEADAALKELQTAVALAPKSAAGYIALGDAYNALGKPDESLKAYDDAAKADPKSPAPARRLARYYGLNGKYAECVAAMNTAKSLTPAEDMASFREDHAALLAGIHSTLSELLKTLGAARVAFVNGTATREATHKAVTSRRKKAEEIAAFLDQIPDVGFGRVQALYGQTATLIAQTAEKYLDYLETDSTSEDEEASLMRIEAAKQLVDADKAMKTLLAAKK